MQKLLDEGKGVWPDRNRYPEPVRHRMRFDLSEGFPVLTTKKLHLRSIIHELLWFLQGDTNIAYLKENESESGMNGRMRATSACLRLSVAVLAQSGWRSH